MNTLTLEIRKNDKLTRRIKVEYSSKMIQDLAEQNVDIEKDIVSILTNEILK